MFWLVPRPASLKETVSDPSLFRLPLALTKCSFCANAAVAIKANRASDMTKAAATRRIDAPWSVPRIPGCRDRGGWASEAADHGRTVGRAGDKRQGIGKVRSCLDSQM